MNQLHVMTVGISLLTNYERENKVARAEVLRRARALDPFLAADPCAASAEINALAARLGGIAAIGADVAVSLVYTQTRECMTTAGAIKRFLKSRGVLVREIKLPGVERPGESRAEIRAAVRAAENGLRLMRGKIAQHVAKMRKQKPNLQIFFNATGGFKAEVAVLYGLGRELGIPVYYLHETYRTVIELP